MAKSVRDQLREIAEKGVQAEQALQRLDLLDKAEAADSDLDTIREAVQVAESVGDFVTAGKLKARQLALLRRQGGV